MAEATNLSYSTEQIDELLKKIDSSETFTVEEKTKLEETTTLNNTTLGYQVKNLLANNCVNRTTNGVTAVVNTDGSITLSGRNTANANFLMYWNLQTGETNQYSNNKKWIPDGNYILSGSASGAVVQICVADEPDVEGTITSSRNGDEAAFSITPENKFTWGRLLISASATFTTPVTVYPMIRRADAVDTAYETYAPTVLERFNDLGNFSGLTQATVGYTTKNLLNITSSNTSAYGLTFTVNTDGSITVNGTALTDGIFRLGTITNPGTRTFTLTGCPAGGTYSTYQLCCRVGSSGIPETYEYGNGKTFTITDNFDVAIRIGEGTTADNLTFYPMVRDAAITDSTFKKYRMTVLDILMALDQRLTELIWRVEKDYNTMPILPPDFLIDSNEEYSSYSQNLNSVDESGSSYY